MKKKWSLLGLVTAAILLAIGVSIQSDEPVREAKQEVVQGGPVQLVPVGRDEPMPPEMELPWKEGHTWYSTNGPPDGRKDSKGRTILEFEGIDEYPPKPPKPEGKTPEGVSPSPVESMMVTAEQQNPLGDGQGPHTVFKYRIALPFTQNLMWVLWATWWEHPGLVGFLIWAGPTVEGPWTLVTNWIEPHGPNQAYSKLVLRAFGDWFVVGAADNVGLDAYEWTFTSPFSSPLPPPPP